jgi:hypothetical protein
MFSGIFLLDVANPDLIHGTAQKNAANPAMIRGTARKLPLILR